VDITVQTEVGTSATSSTDHFTFGSPQYLAGPPRTTGPAPANLNGAQLRPIVAEAEAELKSAGYNAAAFNGVTFQITNLAAPLLGLTSGNTIWIDATAEGYGWYTGGPSLAAFRTHDAAHEYQAGPSSAAYGHVDLLSVVMHELGHVLGFPSIDPASAGHDWMTATLGTGTRRLPDPAQRTQMVKSAAASGFDPSVHAKAFATGADLVALDSTEMSQKWLRERGGRRIGL
jgi:hypothetical protein